MAYSLISHVAAPGVGIGGGQTSAAINTAGADLNVIGYVYFVGGTPAAPTDNQGNAYTLFSGTTFTGTQPTTAIYYCQSPTTNSSHTFTCNGTLAYPGIDIAAFSGSTASPADQSNGSGKTTNGTTFQPGTITPGFANELVVGFCCPETSGAVSIDGGFTITDQNSFTAGTMFGAALAYLIQTTAAAANPTWTVSSATADWAGAIASFKAAAGGGSTPTRVYYDHFISRAA